MSIRYIYHKDLDKKQWDSCIENSQNETIYAYSDWLDRVADHWDALVMDGYSAVMPLIHKKKYGLKYIYQPFFTQQSGVFSKHDIDADLLQKFIKAIPRKFIRVRMNLNRSCTFNLKGVTLQPNYVMDLSKPYLELFKLFAVNTKRNILKAEANQPVLSFNILPVDFVAFKKENAKLPISDKTWLYLTKLLEFYDSRGKLKIFGATENDRLTSAICFLFSKKRVYYLVSANNQRGMETAASFFLVNSFIQQMAGSPIILDFEGSKIEGVARFFKGWGAVNEPYGTYKRNLIF